MRQFTRGDVINGRIQADTKDLSYDPPAWMRAGLQETATGYGMRLNSGYKISYENRQYRVYITCFSNAGTAWFTAKGEKIIVS